MSDKSNESSVEQRLSSLKPPRDLTLTPNKKPINKKTFAPNLKAVRNKNKPASFESPTVDKKDRRKDNRNKRDSQKHDKRSRDTQNILKSSGIFSEGLGAVSKHSSRISYSNFQRGSGAGDAPFLQKPVINVKSEKQIVEDVNNMTINDILKEEGDEDSLTSKFCPTKLPIQPKYINEFKTSNPELKPEKLGHGSADLFQMNGAAGLHLLQFPDTLPGRGPESSEDGETKVNNSCTLQNLEEGRIGKIVIYKSGKVKLVIGNTQYDINIGMQPHFRQDVVSISTNPEERNGTAVNVGTVQNKLIIVPDWERLFEDAAKSNK